MSIPATLSSWTQNPHCEPSPVVNWLEESIYPSQQLGKLSCCYLYREETKVKPFTHAFTALGVQVKDLHTVCSEEVHRVGQSPEDPSYALSVVSALTTVMIATL